MRRFSNLNNSIKFFILLLSLVILNSAAAADNQPTLPIPNPHSSQFGKTGPTFWQEELPSIFGRYFPTGWVYVGDNANSGLHATVSGCTSPAFSVEAFISATDTPHRADRVVATNAVGATGATTASISYSTLGVPGCSSGTSTVRVVVCSNTSNAVGNFHRSGTSNYFANFVDTVPDVPSGCSGLMDVTIVSGNITAVVDIRKTTPFDFPTPPVAGDIETVLKMTVVSEHITSGDGSGAHPWVGWDSAITWQGGVFYYFPTGIYKQTTPIVITGENITISMAPGCTAKIVYDPGSSSGTIALTIGQLGVETFTVNLTNVCYDTADSTHNKTAIRMIDVSEPTIRNLVINGNSGAGWTGAGSVGLRVEGREFYHVDRCTIFANRPLNIKSNPNNPNISMDQSIFSHCYLNAIDDTLPVITINPGVVMANTTFFDTSAIHGLSMIGWSNVGGASTANTSYNILIDQYRWEQSTSGAPTFDIQSDNALIQNLTIRQGFSGNASDVKGYKFKRVRNLVMENVYFTGDFPATGACIDVDGTTPNDGTYPITLINAVCASPSSPADTVSYPGECVTFSSGQSLIGGKVPGSAITVIDIPLAGCPTPGQVVFTFIPRLDGATTPGTNTYAADGRLGFWYQKDNLIKIFARIALVSKDVAMAGTIFITFTDAATLPHVRPPVPLSTDNYNQACHVRYGKLIMTGYTSLAAIMPPGNGDVIFFKEGDNTSAGAGLDETSITDDTLLEVDCTFITP